MKRSFQLDLPSGSDWRLVAIGELVPIGARRGQMPREVPVDAAREIGAKVTFIRKGPVDLSRPDKLFEQRFVGASALPRYRLGTVWRAEEAQPVQVLPAATQPEDGPFELAPSAPAGFDRIHPRDWLD